MVRKFTKSVFRPVFFYWLGITVIVTLGLIKREELNDSMLDINVHDTYFVIAQDYLIILSCFFLSVLGLIYLLFERIRIPLNNKLGWMHSMISMLGAVFIVFPFSLFSRNSDSVFSNELADVNSSIVIVLSLVVLSQVMLPINIVLSIIKKRAK